MAKQRHLNKAPITEAVIDYRVVPSPNVAIGALREALNELKGRFPLVDERVGYEYKAEFSKEGRNISQSSRDKGIEGFNARSGDGQKVAQFRLDGFTFNKLKPYTSWEEVFSEASALWELYKRAASPELVTRIAVRYLNHLALPRDVPPSTHITAPLPLPDALQRLFPLAHYLTRVVVTDAERGLFANIIQSLDQITEDKVVIILDIDAYKTFSVSASDQELKDTFANLREFKNRIFFENLTEKALEEYG